MPLFRIERTSVAIVEAPDEARARKAWFSNEWQVTTVAPVRSIEDVPEDWLDAPAVDTAARDLPGTVRERIAASKATQ